MVLTFRLEGQEFMALNRGPHLELSEAFPMVVNCETQDEVDRFWDPLSASSRESRCSWMKGRFGLRFGLLWQIVPTALGRRIGDPDPEKSNRMMAARLKMNKLEVDVLQRAYDGR